MILLHGIICKCCLLLCENGMRIKMKKKIAIIGTGANGSCVSADLISNGFLVEGSSHYQFLFTRWLLELGLVAEEKNDELTANLIFLYSDFWFQDKWFFQSIFF